MYRFAPLFSLFFAALAASILAVPALATPEPVVLRVFFSSNLHGEIGPCG